MRRRAQYPSYAIAALTARPIAFIALMAEENGREFTAIRDRSPKVFGR